MSSDPRTARPTPPGALRGAAWLLGLALGVHAADAAAAPPSVAPTTPAPTAPPPSAPAPTPAQPAATAPSKKIEVSADAAAAAEALFQEARTLAEKKDYAAACPKFAESQRLDPGIGTLLNLGDCYEKGGKLASAWATYREAMAEANRTDQKQRERDAAVLAGRVEPRLARITLRVPPASQRPGLRLTRDGLAVDRAQWGLSIPIDAGSHELRAEAPKHAPWSTKVTVEDGTKQELDVPPLEALPEPPPPPVPSSTQRTVGFVAGGVGLAGLAAGSVLGLVAMNLRSDARQLGCDDAACATTAAKEKNDSALGAANASTVVFIGGGLLTAAGIVLVATAPRTTAAPAASTVSRTALVLRGTTATLEGRF